MPNETLGDSPPPATITTTHGDVLPRPLAVPAEIVEWVIDRQTRGADLAILSSGMLTATMQLRDLMTAELARVVFTLPEAELMVDAVDDTMFSPYLVGPEMAKRIEEGAEDAQEYSAADCGFENNEQLLAFIERLKFYGPTCDFAIRDATSRWYKQDPAQRAKTIEGFASVGLRVVPDELARVVLEEGLRRGVQSRSACVVGNGVASAGRAPEPTDPTATEVHLRSDKRSVVQRPTRWQRCRDPDNAPCRYATQLGQGHRCSSKNRVIEIGIREVGIAEVGSREVSSAEVCSS